MSGIAAGPLSKDQAEQILGALRDRLHIVLTCSRHISAGLPITAALVPAATDLDASDLLNGTLDLGGLVKNTLFKDAKSLDIPDPRGLASPDDYAGGQLLAGPIASNVLGGVPFVSPTEALPLTAPPPPLPLPPPPPPPPPPWPPLAQPIDTNVTGLLGQLFGTLNLPSLNVKMELTWRVRSGSGQLLSETKDFLAPAGLNNPSLSVTVMPGLIRELRLDTLLNPGGSVVCLSLDVNLSIGPFDLPFTLGPIPVMQLPLFIPTVVAMFTEPNFDLSDDSAALIVVPEHSPFSSAEALFKVLQNLEQTTSALRDIAGLAGFFLGLDDVLGSLPQQPRLRFAALNRIDEFDDYTIKRRPWYNPLGSDRTFDDVVNSLFVFGVPGTEVKFFNDEFCKDATQTKQGGYTITLGSTFATSGQLPDFFIAIRSLFANNDVAPPTFPPGRITVFDADQTGDDSWDTDLSSLCFSGQYLQSVQDDVASPTELPDLVCKRFKVPGTDVPGGGRAKHSAQPQKRSVRTR